MESRKEVTTPEAEEAVSVFSQLHTKLEQPHTPEVTKSGTLPKKVTVVEKIPAGHRSPAEPSEPSVITVDLSGQNLDKEVAERLSQQKREKLPIAQQSLGVFYRVTAGSSMALWATKDISLADPYKTMITTIAFIGADQAIQLTKAVVNGPIKSPFEFAKQVICTAIPMGVLTFAGFMLGHLNNEDINGLSEKVNPYMGDSVGARLLVGAVFGWGSFTLVMCSLKSLYAPGKPNNNDAAVPLFRRLANQTGLAILSLTTTDAISQGVMEVAGKEAVNSYFPVFVLPTFLMYETLSFMQTKNPFQKLGEEYEKAHVVSEENQAKGLMQQETSVSHPQAKAVAEKVKLGMVFLVAGAAMGCATAQGWTNREEQSGDYLIAGSAIVLGAGLLVREAVRNSGVLWQKATACVATLFPRLNLAARENEALVADERSSLVAKPV